MIYKLKKKNVQKKSENKKKRTGKISIKELPKKKKNPTKKKEIRKSQRKENL